MFARHSLALAAVFVLLAPQAEAQHRNASPRASAPAPAPMRAPMAAPAPVAPRAPMAAPTAPRAAPTVAGTPRAPMGSPVASGGPRGAVAPGMAPGAGRAPMTSLAPATISPGGRAVSSASTAMASMTRVKPPGGPGHPVPGGRNTVINNTTINKTVNVNNNYNTNYNGYNQSYPTGWVGGGWGSWGWGWVGGCPGCWYAGVTIGAAGFIGGMVVGTMLAVPEPVYVQPVAPTGVVTVTPNVPAQLERVESFSATPAFIDPKTGLTCADRTVQRPKTDGTQYLYTAKFCKLDGQWQEYMSVP